MSNLLFKTSLLRLNQFGPKRRSPCQFRLLSCRNKSLRLSFCFDLFAPIQTGFFRSSFDSREAQQKQISAERKEIDFGTASPGSPFPLFRPVEAKGVGEIKPALPPARFGIKKKPGLFSICDLSDPATTPTLSRRASCRPDCSSSCGHNP